MPNHMAPIDSMEVNGMAPELCLPQMKKLTKNPRPKMTPGYRVAVEKAAFFHSLPFVMDMFIFQLESMFLYLLARLLHLCIKTMLSVKESKGLKQAFF